VRKQTLRFLALHNKIAGNHAAFFNSKPKSRDYLTHSSGTSCKYTNGESGLPPAEAATYTLKDIRLTNRVTGASRAIHFQTVA
jgi:hypothetical protein